LKRLMAYRIECAETEEEKEKERNFTGLGLTSRKNLCIHPEVCNHIPVVGSFLITITRCPRKRRGRWWMRGVAT